MGPQTKAELKQLLRQQHLLELTVRRQLLIPNNQLLQPKQLWVHCSKQVTPLVLLLNPLVMVMVHNNRTLRNHKKKFALSTKRVLVDMAYLEKAAIKIIQSPVEN